MAVIEEKFNVYEKMMDKLESAIQTISEINQNISRMLSVHEEKIDSNTKTDEIIFEKFRRMEEKNDDDHKRVIEKIGNMNSEFKSIIENESKKRVAIVNKMDKKLSSLMKFRWVVIGGLVVASFVFSNREFIFEILTPNQTNTTIEKVK
jgi:predicted  nucleic acid-binding Zn-ribbon protein